MARIQHSHPYPTQHIPCSSRVPHGTVTFPAAWPMLCRPAISDAAQLSHVDMAWHSRKRAASLATRSGTESDEAAWWRSYTCEMQHRQQQRRQLVQRKLEDLICNMPPAMQPATCRTNAQLTCHLSPFHHGACHAPQAGRGRHAARPSPSGAPGSTPSVACGSGACAGSAGTAGSCTAVAVAVAIAIALRAGDVQLGRDGMCRFGVDK